MKSDSLLIIGALGVGAYFLFKNLGSSGSDYSVFNPTPNPSPNPSPNPNTQPPADMTPRNTGGSNKVEEAKTTVNGGVSTMYNVTNGVVGVSPSQNISTSGIGVNKLKPQSGGVPSGWAAISNSPQSIVAAYYAAPQLKGVNAVRAAYGI